MNLLQRARRLESTLSRSMDDAARRLAGSGTPRQPLDAMHAIVDAVGARLEPAGRGRFVFPFNRIDIAVAAPRREDRARFEAVFDEDPTLERRIRERLRDAGAEPSSLQVELRFVAEAETSWEGSDFDVQVDRVAEEPPDATVVTATAAAASSEPLKLAVLSGTAEKPSYAFAPGCINLGRCVEVRDSRHRLLRTNHVAFTDTASGVNHTVSRRHAHIDYVAAGRSRVCDDGSAHGTSVVRHGRTIPVPTGTRGVRLHPGDEIVLGDARLRVK